jgi:hypothetical protein
VDGVLLIGTTGSANLTPASDYDLIVLLSQMPAPLHVGLTYIDGRLADVIFVTTEEIDRLLALGEEVKQDSWDDRLFAWLRSGHIAFDRSNRLTLGQAKAKHVHSMPQDEGERYGLWFGINYNVRQTLRILSSDDPVYAMTVDLRLLYSLADIWTAYFRLRGLPWQGEKMAIRYLMEHDPDYLQLFQACLAEPDRKSKVEQYVTLAHLALAPMGGLWAEGSTAFQFHGGQPWHSGQDEAALAFWEELVGDVE